MKNWTKHLFACFFAGFLLGGVTPIFSQSDCYVQLDDASGYDISPYQADLDAKACELVAAFPDSTYVDSFKVYGFGFYVELEYYDTYSYPQAFLDVKEEVASLSPYYLLIGRQSDPSGIFTKFWFDLKLPDSWLDQCFDQAYISMLKTSIIFNFNQIDYSKNPIEYAEFEKQCMLYLKNVINELAECCQPSLKLGSLCDGCITEPDVDEFFLSNGFDSLSIMVLNPDTSIVENCLCQTEGISLLGKENNRLNRSSLLNDFTHGYVISLDGIEFNLSGKGLKILEIYDDAYVVITHSLNYCQENFYSLMTTYNNSSVAFWFHVSEDKLYFMGKGLSGDIIIGPGDPQHLDQLICILEKFESAGVNLYLEILQKFDDSRKDFIVNVDYPPGDPTVHGQTIDNLLGNLGVVEIYLNPDQFDIIEDYPLRPAATLIHEMCHGLLSLYVLKAKGPSKCTLLDYSYYYSFYQDVGTTDECVIARSFVDKQAELLWLYNDKHMEKKYYLSPAWGPYFESYKDCSPNVYYTQSQISDWYLEMRDSNPNPFPCTSN